MIRYKKIIITLVALLAVTTGAWAETGENIFQYCYDCQRSPAYPKTTASASLSGFANPLVGYKGSGFGMDNTSAGPWKLEYVGLWSTTDKHGIDDYSVSNYQSTYNCTDVPVFRLYQWNATANEYQHAAYGVVCSYAKVSNAVEHTALFVAQGGWGCVLTNSSHSSSMNITFDEDLSTGLTTLIAAATPNASSGTAVEVDWNKTSKTGTFDMPGGNVELEPEYYPQAALTAAPTAINDVPATTDGAIVKAGTVKNIGSTETAQGTVMYYVSTTALDDAALLALAADQWTADVPTAESFTAAGQAYVYYYVRGNDSDTDEENFSDGDILAANALTVTIAAEPTYAVTFADDLAEPDKWTASPNTDVTKGETVTVTYTGSKKVLGVKAEKAAPAGTDLSTINAEYTASNGETLTGTLASNVKISIADGATVTLNNVTINGVNDSNYDWAGITCLGDATIILSGTNTVNGFYQDYPGIQAAAGKTLIINGTGSLTASTYGWSAGIGGGKGVACGNIEIQDGTITATGGQYGAGIGGGNNASCGNITISGGTVTATGGERGAGIGGGRRALDDVSCGNILISGGTVTATGGESAAGIGGGRGNNNKYLSNCGTITITTGVTKVTATKGEYAPNSIGAGEYGTCGTVTISGNVGAITTSPYTYPAAD